MQKTLMLLISIFEFMNLFSQEYYNSIDSTIASYRLADTDWIIGLTIDQPGQYTLYDSLGNSICNDPNGTYILTKINNRYNLQKIDRYLVGEALFFKTN